MNILSASLSSFTSIARICSCFAFCILVFFSSQVFWADLLDKVYDLPQTYQHASDKDADDFFKTKVSVDAGGIIDGIWSELKDGELDWDGDRSGAFWLKWSVISRTAQFMLRLVAILAIPMILYAWIKIILSKGDEWQMKEWLKLVWYIVLWILVALWSVLIVYLIVSLTWSNLDLI